MTVAVIVILGAAVLGTLANVVWGPALKRHQDKRGVSEFLAQTHTSNNYGPAATLLALLVAFVLAGATSSFQRAKTAAQSEAATVDHIFESADYLKEPQRERLQMASICYARAVVGPEWKQMGETGASSSVPANWTGTENHGIRSTLVALGPEHVLFRKLAAAEDARSEARGNRLVEATPSVPTLMLVFMVGVMAAMIIFLALASPRLSPFHIGATAISAFTLMFAISLIYTLDRPFGGAIKIDPVQMQITEEADAAEFTERYGEKRIRCDENGNPTKARTS
jgi:hypothetical protein